MGRGIDNPRVQGWPHFSGPHPDLAFVEDFHSWPKVVDGTATTSTVYATTDQVDDTLAAIGAASTAAKPYFVTLALSAPHKDYHKPPNELITYDSLIDDPTPDRPLQQLYYRAMIEAMDTELGRLLAGVDFATTTIIFLGDNGTPNEVTAPPYNPDHAKLRVYEQGVRVPLIVAGAGVAAPGRKIDGLVNTVDLYPTILRLAGINPADVLGGRKIDGVSLLPYIANTSSAAVRSWAYAEKFDLAYNQKWERAIRDTRYKLIERATGLAWPVREFFDLKNDPYETRNLLKQTLTATQRNRLNYLNRELDRLLATR